jgi:hypothetical protein
VLSAADILQHLHSTHLGLVETAASVQTVVQKVPMAVFSSLSNLDLAHAEKALQLVALMMSETNRSESMSDTSNLLFFKALSSNNQLLRMDK